MSRCSAIVFTVNGRVGFVDDGKIFGNEAIFMMSGACPPPAPSVVIRMNRTSGDRVATVASRNPSFVDRVRVNRHLHVKIVSNFQAGIDTLAAGVLPQSSMQLQSASARL